MLVSPVNTAVLPSLHMAGPIVARDAYGGEGKPSTPVLHKNEKLVIVAPLLQDTEKGSPPYPKDDPVEKTSFPFTS